MSYCKLFKWDSLGCGARAHRLSDWDIWTRHNSKLFLFCTEKEAVWRLLIQITVGHLNRSHPAVCLHNYGETVRQTLALVCECSPITIWHFRNISGLLYFSQDCDKWLNNGWMHKFEFIHSAEVFCFFFQKGHTNQEHSKPQQIKNKP